MSGSRFGDIPKYTFYSIYIVGSFDCREISIEVVRDKERRPDSENMRKRVRRFRKNPKLIGISGGKTRGSSRRLKFNCKLVINSDKN